MRVDFALRANGYDPIVFNNEPVQLAENVRYLGVHLSTKLNWKREQPKLRFRDMYTACSELKAEYKIALHYGAQANKDVRHLIMVISREQQLKIPNFTKSQGLYGRS